MRIVRDSTALAALALALVPASGLAASAQVTGGELRYTAAPGETNNLVVSREGSSYRVRDTGPGVAIAPGAGCAPAGADALCAAAGVDAIAVRVGDQNDSAVIATSVTGVDGDLRGQAGNDTLTGGANIENFLSGDEFGNPDGSDVLTGGDLNDRISGAQGNDVANGLGGRDSLDDSPGNDVVRGGAGDDRLFAASDPDGADVLEGGPGNDSAEYGERSLSVRLTANGVADDGQAGEGDNLMADVERLFTGSGDDVLTGGPVPNELFSGDGSDDLDGGGGPDTLAAGDDNDALGGSAGNDELFGNDGVDTMAGGTGDDSLFSGLLDDQPDSMSGGPGIDLADYSFAGDAVSVSLDGVANDGVAGEGDNVAADIEDVFGGEGDDTLIGNSSANLLQGGDGSDVIAGLAGPDGLLGERGDDSLDGGASTDELVGAAGADSIRSRDGGADAVSCGAGADGVQADASDEPDADCEESSTGVVLARGAIRVSKDGRFEVPLACPAAEAIRCEGRLTISSAKKLTSASRSADEPRRKRRLVLATRRFEIAAGDRVKLELRLTRRARRAIGDRVRTPARLRAVFADAAGDEVSTGSRATLRQRGGRR